MAKQYPSFGLDHDHIMVHVEVTVPWSRSALHYDHAFDARGVAEEFQKLPEIRETADYFRRRELLDKREKSVEAISKLISRSILNAINDFERD